MSQQTAITPGSPEYMAIEANVAERWPGAVLKSIGDFVGTKGYVTLLAEGREVNFAVELPSECQSTVDTPKDLCNSSSSGEPVEALPPGNGILGTLAHLPLEQKPPASSMEALPGVCAFIGALPPGALVTEEGLAGMFDKCTASIKAAVDRGELPRPARLMGKNTWTAGAIVRHHEARLDAEARKFARFRA